MIVKGLLLLMVLSNGALYGSFDSVAMQEVHLYLEHLKGQLHAHSTDLALFQERLLKLENNASHFKQELKAAVSEKGLDKRLSFLEKAQEMLIEDFKAVKTHFNEMSKAVDLCQSQLTKIDKQITSDIQSLKGSLHSMLALLQAPTESQKSYVVQSGDSLGQIALTHKTDIKTLKKLNHLSSDVIFAGQKLILP